MCGDGFSAPDRVDAFIGFGFQVNLLGCQAEDLRGLRAFRKMRPQFGPSVITTASTCSIVRTFLPEVFARARETSGCLPFHLGSVSENECRYRRVPPRPGSASHTAWARNIAVGVPDRSFVEWKRDAADDERAGLPQGDASRTQCRNEFYP